MSLNGFYHKLHCNSVLNVKICFKKLFHSFKEALSVNLGNHRLLKSFVVFLRNTCYVHHCSTYSQLSSAGACVTERKWIAT